MLERTAALAAAGRGPGIFRARAPAAARITRMLRLARVGLHLARGMVIAGLVFPFIGPRRRRAHIRGWARELLDVLAVRLRATGLPPRRAGTPLMLVANHVSWLDIFAVNAVLPVRFVAKSEVRAWPVIGWLSGKAGTLYVKRARRHDAARVNGMLAQAMLADEAVALFPEGTTTDGSAVLRFHSALLEPAVLAGATLQPVAIRYLRADGTPCAEAAYIGEKTVWDTLQLMLAQPEIRAEVVFLPPLECRGRPRRELACAAREVILRSLFPAAPGSHAGTADDPPAATR